jgi:hypothetical protein
MKLSHLLRCTVIDLPWRGDGTLRVSAGGATFTCTVDEDGKVTFENSSD